MTLQVPQKNLSFIALFVASYIYVHHPTTTLYTPVWDTSADLSHVIMI